LIETLKLRQMALRRTQHLLEEGVVIDLRYVDVDAVIGVGALVEQLFAGLFGAGQSALLAGGSGLLGIVIELPGICQKLVRLCGWFLDGYGGLRLAEEDSLQKE
jgi:hypothetical protein